MDPLSELKRIDENQKKSMLDEMQNIEVEDINECDEIKTEDEIVAKLKASQALADFNDVEENILQNEIVMIEDDQFMYSRQRRATMANDDREEDEDNIHHSEDIDSSEISANHQKHEVHDLMKDLKPVDDTFNQEKRRVSQKFKDIKEK